MRWLAPDGVEWDSKFEYEVYLGYVRAGAKVRKTGLEDSVSFTRPVRNGCCLQCSSGEVVTRHTYTPDLSVVSEDDRQRGGVDGGGSDYLEAKGYLRADQRSLLRALCKSRPDLRLRLLVQRDYRVTKQLTITAWARKFLKIPAAVWSGEPPAWGGVEQ